jgi:serine/threonine-protein kinase
MPQSSPRLSAPQQAMSTAAAMPMEPAAASNRGMLIGGLGVAALVAIGYFFMQGPDTGDLAISVSGPGGKAVTGVVVSVDGVEVCKDSVCKLSELDKGSHKVSARAPGYDETAPRLVSVKAGEEEVLNLELVSSTAGTGLDVDLKAPGMTLSLDGKEIGPLPQKVMDLTPGTHQVELAGNKLFKPFKDSVTLEAGKVLDFEPKLQLEQGQLTISLGDNASGAKILLEGGGKTFALHKKKLPLTINIPADQTFSLTATRDGYADFNREIRFSVEEPQKSIEISLSSEDDDDSSSSSSATSSSSSTRSASSSSRSSSSSSSGQGMININSIPVSNVILDGRPIGSTPKLGVKVSAGRHTVVFVHPQHGRKTSSVNVAAGGTATAAVRFP